MGTNNFRVIERPTTSPVSVDDLKDHLQLYGDDSFDDYLSSLLLVANDVVSSITGEFVGANEIQAYFSRFDEMYLSHNQLEDGAISMLQYYDTDNVLQTVDTDVYFLDLNRVHPKVDLELGQTWPTGLHTRRENPIVLTYEADMLPYAGEDLTQAILIICADLFNQRASTVNEVSNASYFTAKTLLMRYRRARW